MSDPWPIVGRGGKGVVGVSRRGRSPELAPLGGLVLAGGLVAAANWRPDWLHAAVLWCFNQCQVIAAIFVNAMLHR